MERAGTACGLANSLTHKQGHVGSTQAKVADQTIVNLFYLLGPVGLTVIALTLMEQDAFDNARLLGYTGHIDKPLIRVVVVGLEVVDEPALGVGVHRSDIRCDLFLHEAFNLGATDSDVNDTHLDIPGQVLYHGTAKVVGHAETRTLTDNGRRGGVPLSHRALGIGEVDASQHLEARIDILVDGLGRCVALHVRLAEAEVDIEVRIDARRRLLAVVTGEHHLIQIAVGSSNGHAQDMLSGCQRLGQGALHHLVVAPVVAACLRNADATELRGLVVVPQADGEPSTSSA